MTPAAPIRVAVVGAGPSGFYATDHLIRLGFEVDLLECLPSPYGLIRAGVAPDHPKIKSIARVFERIGAHTSVRFFGGVTLGADVSREELLERYTAVVYALGTELDARLGVPGEDLRGSHPATEFVCWYNGHPSRARRRFVFDDSDAVIIGNGNVAIDVARMLMLPDTRLRTTDAADHALDALAASKVRQVTIVGRRGPAQAAFTNPELIELGRLDDVDVIVDPADLVLDAASAEQVAAAGAGSPVARRLALLAEFASRPPSSGSRRIVFRFCRSPVRLLAAACGERVAGVELGANELGAAATGEVTARTTGRVETVSAGLVIRAVGYRSSPVAGLPIDSRTGVLANVGGRLVHPDGSHRPGEYAVGWAKRGPSGVIGTNKSDAEETVTALAEDLAAGSISTQPAADADEVRDWLHERVPHVIDWQAWSRIDQRERERGEPHGRPRVKFTSVDDLRSAAGSPSPAALGSDRPPVLA